MKTQTQTLEEKLTNVINDNCERAERNGSTKLSTCDAWDRDIWNHHNEIISAIRNRGYNVSTSVNWGVLDIVITKKLNLS